MLKIDMQRAGVIQLEPLHIDLHIQTERKEVGAVIMGNRIAMQTTSMDILYKSEPVKRGKEMNNYVQQ